MGKASLQSGALLFGGGALLLACSSACTPGDGQLGSGGSSAPDEQPSSGGTANGEMANGGGTATESSASDRSGCKRGVAYGYHSVEDLHALSPAVSWWYNWYFEPEAAVSQSYQAEGVEFVPMVWGANTDLTALSDAINADATHLLGFNEPNFAEQANLSAAQAASLWSQVENIANSHELKLVSPAVNYCGGGCQDENPFDYLDAFFAACSSCRVDAVAFHIYVGCEGSAAHPAQWLINQVEEYKSRFSKPLWLTEFACTDAASFEQQRAFMEDAVAYLENEPRIERYAWFAGRADNVPYVDLLGANGELTELGQAYVDAAQPSQCVH